MRSFYSIFYITSDSPADEKIAVGMLANSQYGPIFDYSSRKLSIAGKLVGNDVVGYMEQKLKKIKKKSDRERGSGNQLHAFSIDPFSSGYISYVHGYANNVLVVSEPEYLKEDISIEVFTRFFRHYVDQDYGIKKPHKSKPLKKRFRSKLKQSQLANCVDINYKIKGDLLESVYRDHEVDYIGVNGSIASGNSIDLNSDPRSIEYNLLIYRQIATGLNRRFPPKSDKTLKNRHIAYINEPEGKEQKELLYLAKKDSENPLIFKDWEEFEEEEEKLLGLSIRKFSDIVDENLVEE